MNARHWIGVVALCGLSVAGAELLRADPVPPTTPSVAAPARTVELRTDDAQTDALWARLRRLEGELRDTEGELHAAEVPSSAGEAQMSDEPLPSPEELAERRAIYRSQLEDILDAETQDPTWGPQTESTIDESLRTFGNEHVTVHGLECRATLCRLELTIAEEGDPMGTMDGLMGRPGFTLPGMANMETDPDGTERVFVFLARDAEGGLPQPPA